MGFVQATRLTIMLLALLTLLLQGCATSAQKSASMRQFLEQGHPELALIEVEKNGDDDYVMFNMNLGILRRLNGDYAGSNEAFERAKKRIEELYTTSLTQAAGTVIINDETMDFDGDSHEQIMIHLYKASNYLDMGMPDSARVEMLQSHVKMNEWNEPKDEAPFLRYVSGIIFEILGEQDGALVSYRQAVDAYKVTRSKHGLNVPRQLKNDLLRLLSSARLWNEFKQYQREFSMPNWSAPDSRGKGELIVIMHNGLVPQRTQQVIHTWSNQLSLSVRIALPAYTQPPRYLNQVRLTVAGQRSMLETVSNIDGMARAALLEDMPAITARALARAVVKKRSEKEVGEHGLLGQLAMFAVNQATEIADTRCWNTLPQAIQLARIYLPQGEHQLKLDILGPGGVLRDSYVVPVSIRAGQTKVLSRHWTAPRMTIKGEKNPKTVQNTLSH
ncbi:MAG: COG3014 family protein [Gammaproteobacteria bacterium]